MRCARASKNWDTQLVLIRDCRSIVCQILIAVVAETLVLLYTVNSIMFCPKRPTWETVVYFNWSYTYIIIIIVLDLIWSFANANLTLLAAITAYGEIKPLSVLFRHSPGGELCLPPGEKRSSAFRPAKCHTCSSCMPFHRPPGVTTLNEGRWSSAGFRHGQQRQLPRGFHQLG